MRPAIALFALLVAMPAFAQQTTPAQPAASAAKPAKPSGAMQQNLGLGKHDMSAPINVTSTTFEGDLATKVGTYIGNVIVVQGDMKMRADRVRLDVTKGSLSLVTATGNVVVDAPNGTGTGDTGVYDLNTHLVTLTGNKVVLTKGKDVMRGTKLVMDMNTNLAHLTAQGMQGNRVTASFTPPPQKGGNTGTAPPKTPPATGK